MSRNKNHQDLFEHYPIPKAVWTLAIPTTAAMLVNLFYNLADTFFVGQTNDAMQVAAVSLAMPVFLVFLAFGNLYGLGGGATISRFLGAGRKDDIKHVSSFAFYASIGTGIIIGALALLFMDTIVPLMGTSENTHQYVYQYMTYLAYGAPFIVLAGAYANIVRSIGFAKEAMVGMMIGTVTNIVLDPIMILVLDMGVVGAAVATVIGNIAASCYYILLLYNGSSGLSIHPRDFSAKAYIVTNVLKIGVPAALNSLLFSISNMIYNAFISGYGEIPLAGMGIANKCNMLMVMIYMGITQGAQPLIGYTFGAKNYARMKAAIKYIITVALCVGVAGMALFMLFAEPIVSVFIDDSEVIAYGSTMLRVLSSTAIPLGIIFVSMSTLQGMGRALPSLLISVSRQGLVFIPVAIFANHFLGFNGLIWTQPTADTVSVLFSITLLILTIKKITATQPLE